MDSFGGTGMGLDQCNNCGNQIMAIEFENENARLQYANSKKQESDMENKRPRSTMTQSTAVFSWEMALGGMLSLIIAAYFAVAQKEYLLAAIPFLTSLALFYFAWKAYIERKKQNRGQAKERMTNG